MRLKKSSVVEREITWPVPENSIPPEGSIKRTLFGFKKIKLNGHNEIRENIARYTTNHLQFNIDEMSEPWILKVL